MKEKSPRAGLRLITQLSIEIVNAVALAGVFRIVTQPRQEKGSCASNVF